MKFKKNILKNNKGQGLIEYLVIVALIAVAAIGIVQTLQNTVNTQFTNVTNAIGGQNMKTKSVKVQEVKGADYKKRGLNDFMKRANQRGSK